MLDGIITKGIGGFYYVLSGGEVYECKARGVFRKNGITPTVGDHVKIKVGSGSASIAEIEERKNCLVRPPVANVDTLVIVAAAASPDPNLTLIDKMLVQAEVCGVEAVICVNKTDIASADTLTDIYGGAGYMAVAVSAEKGENLDSLYDILKGKVTAFCGLSGVGKSSILNIITGADMETGGLSRKTARGRHTTRHVELLPVSGGFVFDTPGFSSFEILDINAEELGGYFPEIRALAGGCRFRGCSHIKETGCAVRAALEAGKIAKSRYDSYCEMYEILKSKKNY